MLRDIINQIASQLEGTALRLRQIANDPPDRMRAAGVANELRSLFGGIRFDLLIKYGEKPVDTDPVTRYVKRYQRGREVKTLAR